MDNYTNTLLPQIPQFNVNLTPTWLNNNQFQSKSLEQLQKQLSPNLNLPQTNTTLPTNILPQIPSTKSLQQTFERGVSLVGSLASGLYDFIPSADKTINSNDELSENIRGGINKTLLSGAAGPWGTLAGVINMGIDKTGGFTDASKGLGGLTDFGNSVASILLPGAGWFTKKTMDYKVSDTLKESGASYGGTLAFNNKAAQNSGAKLLFGSGKANRQLRQAALSDTKVQSIMEKNDLAQAGANNPYIGIRNSYNMQGGWQNNISFGRTGLKISPLQAKSIALKAKTFQKGGEIDAVTGVDPKPNTFEQWFNKLPQNKRDTTNYNLRRAYQLAPKEELDNFLQNPNSHLKTFYYNSEGIGEFMKSKNHPTLWMELEYYNNGNKVLTKNGKNYIIPADKKEWEDFRNSYELDTSGDYYKYIPKKFKDGGKMNVIPDGALHARKHNMDIEGITKKGIPVVIESTDGKVEQQAEIEKEEIIFRLEVTKKLEELQQKYYSDDSSQKEKDELALEAGKLLVKEILYNTTDNVNLIEKTV